VGASEVVTATVTLPGNTTPGQVGSGATGTIFWYASPTGTSGQTPPTSIIPQPIGYPSSHHGTPVIIVPFTPGSIDNVLTPLGTSDLNVSGTGPSTATLGFAATSTGSFIITAYFSPDGTAPDFTSTTTSVDSDYYESASNGAASVNVNLGSTTTALTSSVATADTATPVTLTATVTGPAGTTPTGNVNFYNGSTLIGTAPLNEGSPDTATLIKTLPNGVDNITAIYVGDSNNAGSTSGVSTVTVSGIIVVPSTLTTMSGSVLAATFANFNTTSAGPFTVTIDWGDGTAQGSTLGVGDNLLTVVSNGGGNYSVTGTHTYIAPNGSVESPIITVTTADGTTGTGTGQVTVTAPAGTIPAGLSMISLPYDYSATADTADEVLGLSGANADDLATWTGSSYAVYPNLPGTGTQTLPGVGYWVREATAMPIVLTGATVASPYTMTAHAGWNEIGDPFTTAIPWSSVTILGGTLTSAVFAYDPISNSYLGASTLEPFQGYWIFITPSGAGSITITYTD
jgi:hypothetical protein